MSVQKTGKFTSLLAATLGGSVAVPLALTAATTRMDVDPTVNLGIATKQYVDAAVVGFVAKAEVAYLYTAFTTDNPTYNNAAGTLTSATNVALSIAGTTLVAGSGTISSTAVTTGGTRLLVATSPSGGVQDGIYYLSTQGSASAPWVLTRSPDANSAAQLNNGVFTLVSGGTYAGTSFVYTPTTAVVLGTTVINFVKFTQFGVSTITATAAAPLNSVALAGTVNSNTTITNLSGDNIATASALLSVTGTTTAVTLLVQPANFSTIGGTGTFTIASANATTISSGQLTLSGGATQSKISYPNGGIAIGDGTNNNVLASTSGTASVLTLGTLLGSVTVNGTNVSVTNGLVTLSHATANKLTHTTGSLSIGDGTNFALQSSAIGTASTVTLGMPGGLTTNVLGTTIALGSATAGANAAVTINPAAASTFASAVSINPVVSGTGVATVSINPQGGATGTASVTIAPTSATGTANVTIGSTTTTNIVSIGGNAINAVSTTNIYGTQVNVNAPFSIIGAKATILGGTLTVAGTAGFTGLATFNGGISLPATGSVAIVSGSTFTGSAAVFSGGLSVPAAATASFVLPFTQTVSTLTSATATATFPTATAGAIVQVSAASIAWSTTLPTAVSSKGQTYRFIRTDSTAFTITIITTETYNYLTGDTSLALASQGDHTTLYSDGASWIVG